MRPFKFFFGAVLGIIVFLFLARFVLIALVIATALTCIFFLIRKMRHFLQAVYWRDRYDPYLEDNYTDDQYAGALLLSERPSEVEYLHDYRSVTVQ